MDSRTQQQYAKRLVNVSYIAIAIHLSDSRWLNKFQTAPLRCFTNPWLPIILSLILSWFTTKSHRHLKISLFLQISDIQVNGQSDDMTAKEKLLLWSQRMVEGYQGLRCDNFTTSWKDGKLFNAIINKHRWERVQLKVLLVLISAHNLNMHYIQIKNKWNKIRYVPEGTFSFKSICWVTIA